MKLEQFCLWTQSRLSQQPLSSLRWHYIMHLNYPGEVNSCVAFVFCYKSQVKKKKAHILFLLLQATESALNEDTQWCPFSVKACESRPTEGCIVEVFYVLGRKRRVVITEAVSWDSALLAGPRSQVPLGFEGAEERGGGRGVGGRGW